MGLLAGLASGAASIGSALIQSNAAQSAAGTQSQYGMLGLLMQQQMFNQAKGALNPYVQAGQNILPTLQALISPSTSASTLSQLPGFQFASQWGTLAAQNQLAAQGLGGSAGPLATAISNYNTGLAQSYWGQDVNALQGFANMGSGAASALGGIASNAGNAMASTLGSIGSAQASGTLGSANALSSGLQGLGNAALLSSLTTNPSGGLSIGNPFGGLYGGAQSVLGNIGSGIASFLGA